MERRLMGKTGATRKIIQDGIHRATDWLVRLSGQPGSLRQQLLHGVLGSVGVKTASILVQFAVGVALARVLGPKMLGVYAFSMAIVQVTVIFAQFGFPSYLVRSAAVHKAKSASSDLRADIIGAGQIVFILSILSITAFIGLIVLWEPNTDIITQQALMFALVLIPLFALAATICGAIRGLGYVVAGQFVGALIRPIVFLGGLLAIYLLGLQMSPQTALLAHALGALATLVAAFLLLRQYLPAVASFSMSQIRHRHLLRQSFPFLLLAGAQVINSQTDILMLGMLTTQDQVGIYRVAVQVASILSVVLFTIAMVISPQIARLHASQSWNQIRRILVYSHRTGLLAMLPLALLVVIFSADFLALVFGEPYRSASGSLNILALGTVPYAAVGFAGIALSMLGKAKIAAVLTFSTVLLNIGLNLVLIPRFGLEGAAIATVVSRFVVDVRGIFYLRQIYKHDFSALGGNPPEK
jgi:O-antigen/teichoic acid export membrane protein